MSASTRRGGALAIDPGTRRTGFAAADALGISVTPLEAWHGDPRDDAFLAHVASLLAERDVGTLVIGLAVNMDGSEGERAAAARALGARLEARFPACAIAYQDERLTTKEAEELMRDAAIPPRERRTWKDSFAALVILRDWLGAA